MKKLLTATLLILSVFLLIKTQTNAQISTGLVGYWTFDEGSGNTAGDSAGSNTGTLVNNPTWLTGSNAKIGNGAIDLSNGSHIRISSASSLSVPYTISFWFYPRSLGTQQGLVDFAYNTSNSPYLFLHGNGRLDMEVNGSGSFRSFSNKVFTTADLNKWWHAVVVVNSTTDSSQWKFYINGVDNGVDSSSSVVNYRAPSTAWGFGSVYNNGQNFNGSLDDIRIYSRALSASEITDLYNYTGGSIVSPPSSTYTLTLNNTNTSGGTVTSSPVGINCGSSCSVSNISGGSTYSLTATPSANYTTSWSGCTSSSGNTCTVTINSNTSVTVGFTANQIPSNTSINCDQLTLQNAINNAARNSIITCNAGSWSWNNPINISKGVVLKGAGRDSTILNSNGIFINISPDQTAITNEEVIRIEGFTFDGNNISLNHIHVSGAGVNSLKPFRNLAIGNNRFKNSGTTSANNGVIIVVGQVRGVIFSNIFDRTNVILKVDGNNDITEFTNNHFPYSYGNSDNLFFESNTIYYSSPFSGQDPGWTEDGQGGRFVMRYNTWNMAGATQTEMWDVHGFQNWPGNGQTGTMISEYYGNIITNFTGYRLLTHRGGWGLFFNNQSSNGSIEVNQYAQGDVGGSGCSNVVPGASGINTEVNNTYVFNNIVNGSLRNMTPGPIGDGCNVSENNGYWNYNPSFNGTSGMGRGTTIPTGSCTIGTAYWKNNNPTPSTDPNISQAGTLYKCISTNVWVPYYAPYTYPHPLANGVIPPVSSYTYNINISAGTGGTVLPGTISVNSGSNQTFTITPYSGYQISSVTVDGINFPISANGGNYTFNNIITNHNVVVSFSPISPTGNKTINALSANYTDVSNAVNSANDGDTVMIPSGNVVWNSKLTLSKAINLIGAGSNQTIISNGIGGTLILVQPTNDLPVRISGIKFDQHNTEAQYVIIIAGLATKVRIDHCYFETGDWGIAWNPYLPSYGGITGPVYGVIDHNIFHNMKRAIQPGDVRMTDRGGNDGSTAWSEPIQPGSINNMYVEDNSFLYDSAFPISSYTNSGDAAIYGNSEGGSIVIRNNIFSGYNSNYLDNHGDVVGGNSSKFYEIYNNTFSYGQSGSGGTWAYIGNSRGGSWLVWGNNINGYSAGGETLRLWNYCAINGHPVKNTYVWNNTVTPGPMVVTSNQHNSMCPNASEPVLNQDYFLRAPTLFSDKFYGYTPFVYPHPLVSGTTVTPPTPIIGDFNNDRLVNSLDFSLLVSAWNQNNATYDINHDGIVNSLDYVVMVQNWTQ